MLLYLTITAGNHASVPHHRLALPALAASAFGAGCAQPGDGHHCVCLATDGWQ